MGLPLKQKPAEALDLEVFRVIEDIPITLYAELDRRTISLRELLSLAPEMCLTLSRPAGENIDVYAVEVLIGSGEVLVVDSKLAIRIADLWELPATAVENTSTSENSSNDNEHSRSISTQI